MKQQWEYITVSISGKGANAVSDSLNKMGQEGWEGWHMIDRPDHVLVFFKRIKGLALPPNLSLRV